METDPLMPSSPTRKPRQAPPPPPQRSSLSPLAVLALFLGLSALWTRWLVTRHFALPTPITVDSVNGRAVFNEAASLRTIRTLAEDRNGQPRYRIVGTKDFHDSERELIAMVDDIKRKHEASDWAKLHQIEVWHQVDNGNHLFEFMNRMVYKKYSAISNVIVRLSDGTDASKANAVLVNAHLDSTLPSPGAADDGAGVGVMLEALRVLASSPEPLANSVIFLFNGAEESLQDASHLYITKHETKDTVRAVINLEACGTTGAEILFQATSEPMIKAYSHVPRPYGAVLATELFATGLIISDTDFRQFEEYGNLTGLDLALVGNSYFYHTRLDVVDEIEPGAMQHMGENTIAMLRHLTSTSLDGIVKSKDTVYFSLMGGAFFIKYSARSGSIAYFVLWLAVLAFLFVRGRRDRKLAYVITTVGVAVTFVAAVVGANIVAIFAAHVRGRALTWYRREYLPLILFGPPALLGALLTQLVLARVARRFGVLRRGEGLLQHTSICALALTYSTAAFFLQINGVLSSYLAAAAAASTLATLLLNDYVLVQDKSDARPVSFLAILFGQLFPYIVASEGMNSLLDLFVPLAGRLGADAPADNIIASIVSLIGVSALPMLWPLSHRLGERFLLRLCAFLAVATVVLSIVFTLPAWPTYDARHPKRVYGLHMENISSSSPPASLLVASADSEMGFTALVASSLGRLGIHTGPLHPATLSEHEPSWDALYPVSQLLNTVAIPLPDAVDYVSPWPGKFTVSLLDESLSPVTLTRKLTLVIDHPGLIWTVVAFDADVVHWDLTAQAPRGRARHHIKEVSGYGLHRWTLAMEVQLDRPAFEAAQRVSQRRKGQRPADERADAEDLARFGLRVDFSGLDRDGMWPASARTYEGRGRPAMDFMRRFDEVLPDYVDAMLLSAVSGVVTL